MENNEARIIEEDSCEICEGLGEVITSAYQQGGKIVDSMVEKCVCQVKEDFEE